MDFLLFKKLIICNLYILYYERIIDTINEDPKLKEKWKKFINGPSTETDYKKITKRNVYFKVQNTDSLISFFKTAENIDLSKSKIIQLYEEEKGEIDGEHKIDSSI